MTSFADLIGVGGITTLADDIVKLIPNKNAEEQAQLQITLMQMFSQKEIDSAQAQTNTAEAENPNLWVSGARPAILWICAAAFAWQFVLLPILLFVNAELHYTIAVPTFDTSSMITILMGMLGLGGMRTFDKTMSLKHK
jgi:nitroreductase